MNDFNLEAALEGAAVQTRSGRSVTLLRRTHPKAIYPLIGELDNGVILTFNIDGTYLNDRQSQLDLFMAGAE